MSIIYFASELTGAALDWTVSCITYPHWEHEWRLTNILGTWGTDPFKPSTNWAQGGPIIERERLLIQPEIGKEGCGNAWNAVAMRDTEAYGPTPLIAAMRCYVASKLGDEVEVPKELS